jgi:hypothetical protein
MSRSLLIVICDFLLLSLLALARFDVTGGEPAVEEVVVAENVRAEQDLIEILRLSLEAERISREELAGNLDTTQQTLAEREETLAEREARLQAMAEDLERREAERQQLESERSTLTEQVTEAQANLETLTQQRAVQEDEARRARELALRMERELRTKLEELERTQTNLAQLETRQREAEEANRRLSTQLELSETEKRLIRENLDHVRGEVAVVRQEKERVQEQARELAQGVTTLAERSGELAQEVRRAQPRTSASIFSDFLANRIEGEFTATRSGMLGANIVRSRRPRSILVTDGHDIYALFHLEETALSLNEVVDWDRVTGRINAGNQQVPVRQLSFLSIDPRVVVIPVERQVAEASGLRIYPIAREPFKFPEAVLINSAGNYYGETTFTVSADTPRYVRMQTRIFSRLFGEFSPSSGDLVFSKTDELIGIMVNNEFCVLVDNFLPAARLTIGDSPTSAMILGHMKGRVDRLPLRMR